MPAEKFIAFIGGEGPRSAADDLWHRAKGRALLLFLLAILGGLAMNLTPCVLPMVPVNLAVIGRSATRGAAYGLGIALAYGALGLAAALGGLAFGTIQASPWFNAAVALVFVLLGLSLLEVFFLDFSRFRPKARAGGGILFAFAMGALAAVLAGACVAPILVAVLLLTADLFAQGTRVALALPFAVGVGMALPWPLVGAGLRVLPKPGRWMRHVNRAFALVVFAFAVHFALLAARGFGASASAATPSETPVTLAAALARAPRPVLVDCWASWCKNCAAMDRVLARPDVREALKARGVTVIRLQAEDISVLRRLPGFERVQGLPAFVLFTNSPQQKEQQKDTTP